LSPKYARGGRRRFVEEIVPQLARIPGVESAGSASRLPLRGEDWIDALASPDLPENRGEAQPLTNFRFVGPGYMQAIGIRLLAGRMLDPSDQDRPRAVISER